MSLPHSTPARRRQSANFGSTNGNGAADGDLAQSLRQLNISNGTPAKSLSPLSRTTTGTSSSSSAAPNLRRSSSVASNRRSSMTPRSPLNGPAAVPPTSRPGSRASTPALLRKASLSSLHSGSGGNNGQTGPPHKVPLRRASSVNLKSPSPGTPLRSPLLGGPGFDPVPEKPPPPTAAEIASKHFKGELSLHHQTSNEADDVAVPAAVSAAAETVVILHDNCYGHRFARPRTSRANLSTIVERPERIQACAVGVSVAYVRLGARHAEGAYMPHPQLQPASIPSVPFRIRKTTRTLSLLAPAVTNVHGSKWMEELKLMCDTAEMKLALNGKELQRPEMDRGPPNHSAPPARLHEGDLYLCSESLNALEGALGGVCEAVDTVFAPPPGTSPKRAFVAIRPPGHHCSADWPSGFCWINNVHVGIMHGILQHGVTHAAIIDIDLHHGDGSQAIAWQHNTRGVYSAKNATWWKKNTSIGYFSLHDINSFPCESGDEEKVKNASICIENAHGQNVWNVHLEPWKTEAEFWALYESKYSVLLDKMRAFLRAQTERFTAMHQANPTHNPPGKAAIFISAGFDASEWETSSMQRHKVNVPTEFYARLARDVIVIANEEGTSVEGRVISVLEGGYSDRALFSGVLSHLSGLAGSDPVTTKDEAFHSGLGYEMGNRMGAIDEHKEASTTATKQSPYDPAWWTSAELDRIEATIAPAPPEPEPRPAHPVSTPTYFSPTQSSQAKVTTPKVRRSMSGLSSAYGSPASRPASPPPPPPPEVPWTVAFHELSKLLIPTGRTTTSCTVEDLSAEATRARRDRQSLLAGYPIGAPPPATAPATPSGPTRVSQRERKQVKPFGASVHGPASTSIKEEEEERKNRRKTVGGAPSATTAPSAGRGRPPKQSGRRLSAASTVVAEAASDGDMPPVPALPVLQAGPAQGPPSTSSGSTRPASAHSSTATRPGSSTSAVSGVTGSAGTPTSAAAPPLSVRKTRAPSGAATRRDTPAKTPRTKKAGAGAPATTTAVKPSFSRSSSGGSAATSATTSKNDDMDKLTSGMRKIKINVVTAAQKEAREKAKKEQAEKEKAETPKEPAPLDPASRTLAVSSTSASTSDSEQVRTPTSASVVPSPGLVAISRDSSASSATTPSTSWKQQHQEEQQQPTPAAATPVVQQAAFANGPATPLAQTIGAEVPPTLKFESEDSGAETGAGAPLTPSVASADQSPLSGAQSAMHFQDMPAPTVFVPYQPEGETPAPASAQQPALGQQPPIQLHWLPPNEVATPTPSPMKRADLPVFTATSTIPFAATKAGGGLSSSPTIGTSPGSSPRTRGRSPTKSPTRSPRKV